MNKNIRFGLLTLTALGAVAVPLATVAHAQKTGTATTQTQGAQNQGGADAETNDQQPGYTGSIQLPAEPQGSEQPGAEQNDASEAAQYQSLAKITPAQATQAAQAVVPGTVSSVTLGDENGSLIYEVVIGQTAVKVDAGNGRVLQQAAAGQGNEQGGNEQGGGQDGETNDGG